MDSQNTINVREALEGIISEEQDANKELETCEFPQDVSPWGTMSTMAEMARDALPFVERSEKMMNDAIALLINSQYVINYFMAHVDIGHGSDANEVRKLKRGIVEFLNQFQEESSSM